MKRLHFLIAVLAVPAFSACSKTERAPSRSEEMIDTVRVTVNYLAVPASQASFGPRIVFEHDEAILSQYFDSENSDINIFFFQESGAAHRQMLMLASDENILFAPLSISEPVTLLSRKEGFNTLFIGYIDATTSAFEATGSVKLDVTEIATKGDYEDGIRTTIAESLYGKLRDRGSDLADACDVLTGGFIPVGSLIKEITHFAATVGELVVYADAVPDVQEAYVEKRITDYVAGETVDLVIGILPNKTLRAIAKLLYRRTKELLSGRSVSEQEAEQRTDDMTYSIFSRVNHLLPAVIKSYPGVENPYSLTVSVDEVGEDFAVLSGSVSYQGNNQTSYAILEQGFCYKGSGDGGWTYHPSPEMVSQTISLQPATRYLAAYYLRTLTGGAWTSGVVPFITKGVRLVFTPTESFSFTDRGGRRATAVLIGDEAEWRVISSPSWCSYECSPTTIWVSVGAYGGPREGEIVVETTSYYGEILRKAIPVIQRPLSWNSSSWTVTGTLDMAYENGSYHNEVSWRFDFRDVTKGYTETNGTSRTTYSVNTDGQVVVHEVEEFFYAGKTMRHDVTTIFSRIDENTAVCMVDGTEDQVIWQGTRTVHMSGTLTARRQQ